MIFDFDGVIVDSEPIHLAGFASVLAKIGVTLTREDYYGKYLGYDDYDCFATVLRDLGRTPSEEQIAEMTAAKTKLVQQAIATSIQALPGAVELAAKAANAGIPLAICSGALREEILLASQCVGVEKCFVRIVAAEDVAHGKPDPEGYHLALSQLREATGRPLKAQRCVAIEDSPAGIDAAREAGMKVLAVTTSYPADALTRADRIVASLADVTPIDLESLL